jgi:hypothetical protein
VRNPFTADSAATRLTLLVLMPSASTMEMPLRLINGSSGIRTP